MIHQFKDKNQIKNKKKNLRILFFLILFLILAFSGALPFSKKIFNYLGKPLWEFKNTTFGNKENINYLIQSKSSLLTENKNLKEENSKLMISMIDYQILKNENERLREIIGNLPVQKDFLLAGILVKPNNSPYDTLIIDVGEKDQIIPGYKVYLNGNLPIGEIKEVYFNTSLVELYSNPGKITTGIIEDSNVSVQIIGRGGGNFEMLVPLELLILPKSLVFLPGVDSEIIAVVQEEISELTDPIKKIILRSPVNFQNQKWVQVRKN